MEFNIDMAFTVYYAIVLLSIALSLYGVSTESPTISQTAEETRQWTVWEPIDCSMSRKI